jgi:hypothetical protein
MCVDPFGCHMASPHRLEGIHSTDLAAAGALIQLKSPIDGITNRQTPMRHRG